MDMSLTCPIHAHGIEIVKIKGGNLTAFGHRIKPLNDL
jgi:hypothetical protein